MLAERAAPALLCPNPDFQDERMTGISAHAPSLSPFFRRAGGEALSPGPECEN